MVERDGMHTTDWGWARSKRIPWAASRVDHRGPGQGAAVAAERVVALLVGGDQEDLASHQPPPCRPRARGRPGHQPGWRGGTGGTPDDQGQRRRLGIGAVDDQRGAVTQVVDVDGAQVLLEQGAVIRYCSRRRVSSTVTRCSGMGRPERVVTTRSPPSTMHDSMPGNHSGKRPGSPTSAQTASGGQASRTSCRMLPRLAVTGRRPWAANAPPVPFPAGLDCRPHPSAERYTTPPVDDRPGEKRLDLRKRSHPPVRACAAHPGWPAWPEANSWH